MIKILKNFFFVFALFVCSAHATDTMCESGKDNFYAEYVPISIQCQSGSYLPANSLNCSLCSNNYTCNGGTFYFNETQNQGIDYNHIVKGTNVCAEKFSSNFYAVYETLEITCNVGYYLGAGAETCTSCPTNSYCPGGTFYFDETKNQGVYFNHIANGTTFCSENFPTNLYAIYEPKTVTINFDDGDGNTTQSSCVYDGLITIPSYTPTRPGYTFGGWIVDKGN